MKNKPIKNNSKIKGALTHSAPPFAFCKNAAGLSVSTLIGKNIKNKLGCLSLGYTEGLTVIEFSAKRIKIVQSLFKKQSEIIYLGLQDNIEDLEQEFTSALDNLIKKNRLKIDNLIISLDRSLATIRLIKLPSINEDEITDMVKWQAAKLLPYKAEEIIVSHQTIKIDEEGFSYVLLIVVTREVVKKFLGICDNLKLQPKAITLTSQGLAQWYFTLQPTASQEEVAALIDIDKDRAELAILYQEKFIFSRSFQLPFLQQEQFREKLISETKLSVDSFYKQEVNYPLKKIVLVGNRDKIANLSSLLTNEFNLGVEVIDHFQDINFKKKINNLGELNNSSFASIVGLALSQRSAQINLLPQENKNRILFLEKKKELIKTLILAGFAILVFLGLFSFDFYNKKKHIDYFDTELKKTNPVAKEIQEIKNKMTVINSQLDNEDSSIEILTEIHKITPKDIFLNTFIFDEGKEVILKGIAPSMSVAFSFVPILNKSQLFDNVQVRYVTQRKTQTGELTDFEIICKLSNRQK